MGGDDERMWPLYVVVVGERLSERFRQYGRKRITTAIRGAHVERHRVGSNMAARSIHGNLCARFSGQQWRRHR